MPYGKFSLEELQNTFNLTIAEEMGMFAEVPELATLLTSQLTNRYAILRFIRVLVVPVKSVPAVESDKPP